jgi:putative chitinase
MAGWRDNSSWRNLEKCGGIVMINYTALKSALPAEAFQNLESCGVRFQINTPLRMAHFLAQCAHESGGFRLTTENLNYSAAGLLKTFKKYFNEETAEEYANKPVDIASLVYADRMGNGSEESQEGWLYRGRGYIQLTGRENYQKFDLIVQENIVANPDLVSTKYPLLSAAWFWDSRKLNLIADQGATENEIATITKKINGGMNGIAERTLEFNKFYTLLAV